MSADHTARVLGARRVTAHMVRVTLTDVRTPLGAAPLGAGGRPDEFFSLGLPGTRSGEPVRRYYTVRAWRPDAGELDVDLLLHGTGPATQWAARLVDDEMTGERVLLGPVRGHYDPPPHARWIALCGDATALPAIGRILEERTADPGSPPVTVVATVDDPRDRQQLELREGDAVHWVAEEELVPRALAEAERPAPGYHWFSGEASAMRVVRRHLRHTLRRPLDEWTTMGYWRRDSERWQQRFEARGPQLRRRLELIYDSDLAPEEQADQAEAVLAEEGLL